MSMSLFSFHTTSNRKNYIEGFMIKSKSNITHKILGLYIGLHVGLFITMFLCMCEVTQTCRYNIILCLFSIIGN